MEPKIDIATILRGTFALVRANPVPTLVGLLVLGIASTGVDTLLEGSPGMNFVVGIAALFAQYAVTRGALRAAGLLAADGEAGRAGAFVIALILTGLGVMIGFLFLILPGIYLWARWALVAPLVVGEGMTSNEAMGESWARTQALVLPIAGAMLILSVPMLPFYGTLFLYPDGLPPIGVALAANLLLYGAQILLWHSAVVLHGLTRAPSDSLEEVFA